MQLYVKEYSRHPVAVNVHTSHTLNVPLSIRSSACQRTPRITLEKNFGHISINIICHLLIFLNGAHKASSSRRVTLRPGTNQSNRHIDWSYEILHKYIAHVFVLDRHPKLFDCRSNFSCCDILLLFKLAQDSKITIIFVHVSTSYKCTRTGVEDVIQFWRQTNRGNKSTIVIDSLVQLYDGNISALNHGKARI